MSFFGIDMSDPETAARIRGALLGAGQAAAQPYGNLGSIAAGAGLGQQQGLQQYQTNQANKMSLASDQLGMQQKLGSVNFLRNLQGQQPLTLTDIMKGNFGTPMGTPAAPQTIASQPASSPDVSQTAQNAPMGAPMPQGPTPPPIPNAPLGTQAAPQPVANAPLTPQAPPTPISNANIPATSSLIPADLQNNPLFQAAIQSGDSATVMSMLTKHQTQLTPDQLKARNLPSDTLAFQAPDGTVDIKRLGVIKTPEEIQSEVGEEQAKGVKSQAELDQEYREKQREITLQPPSVERNITLPILQKLERGEQLTPGEQAVLQATKPNAIGAPISGMAPGTIGAAAIDTTAPGYSRDVIPNTGGLTQSAIDQGALEFATTGKMPGGMGMGSSGQGGQRKNAIQNRASELNAGGNMTANAANLKALTASLTQQTNYANSTERSVANAENGFQQLTSTFMGKVNNAQMPIVNAITNAAKYQLAPGDISAFRAGLTEVANEYSNVFSRGGIVTDAVRAQAKNIADGNLSIADLSKVMNELQAQGNIVINGSRGQVQKIQGQLNGILQGGGTPAPSPSPQKVWPAPPPLAIQALKMKKDKPNFDAIFGPGAADKALNGK